MVGVNREDYTGSPMRKQETWGAENGRKPEWEFWVWRRHSRQPHPLPEGRVPMTSRLFFQHRQDQLTLCPSGSDLWTVTVVVMMVIKMMLRMVVVTAEIWSS